ncbi:oxidoreductase-like protein [Aureobasidium pullulans]|nr:oxidoreductase-like protein [Aureobasidium pullulans]
MSVNRAAWYTSKLAKPFKVDVAPFPKASPTEVIIKNQAVAINPIDWKVQDGVFDYGKAFPYILGKDVAGIVEAAGSEVKHAKKGDRVIGNTHTVLSQDPKYGGFQLYPAVNSKFVAKIPDTLDFDSAVVLPLAISTAASALFQSDNLGITLPTLSPIANNSIIVLWGGSSSVGALAIQLAKAAGVTVITTASTKNHDLVKALGADLVLDYNRESSITDILVAINESGKTFVGIVDCISVPESLRPCYSILHQSPQTNKLVSLLPVLDAPKDLNITFARAIAIMSDAHKHVGEAIWGEYVPAALNEGKLKAVPKPMVIGKGLEVIQEALAVQKKGVSAMKVVVEL